VELRKIMVQPTRAKSYQDFSINEPGMVVCAYKPGYMEAVGRQIMVQAPAKTKIKKTLKNNESKTELREWLKW
jgi:hypothetical protein